MESDRKKQLKFNLNPRGMTWVNDDSKKCLKMMEKMGWEQGKGLGRKEDGIVDNIRANGNLGKKGLGKTTQARDTWLFQQDEYSNVLADLNQMYGKKDEGESKQTTFTDLRENCKKSTSRVFYSKLVQGKNLSNRSQKDLDCILGPSRKREEEKPTTVKESITNKEEPKEELKSEETEPKPEETNKSSADLIKSQSISISDYFAKKMEAIKKAASLKKNSLNGEQNTATNCNENTPVDNEGKQTNDDDTTKDSSQGSKAKESNADPIKPQSMNMFDYFAKKMEAKKKAAALSKNCDDDDNSQDSKAANSQTESDQSETLKPKKSKKRKHSDSEEPEKVQTEEEPKKKKKKKHAAEVEEEVKVEIEKPKKKKSKTDKEVEVIEIVSDVEEKKAKKSKKRGSDEDGSSKVDEIITIDATPDKQSKKKKKKSKE